MKTGDIYLVKFHPGYGSELEKYRPAVIVSQKINEVDSRFALIAPLTTKVKGMNIQAEMLIKKNPVLEKDSVLLCWYLWTIDTKRLVRKLGQLSSEDISIMRGLVRRLV